MLLAICAATLMVHGSVLQLHDASGTGTIEFEQTATAVLNGDVNGINSSVPITLTSGASSCTLRNSDGALHTSCPILSPNAQACDEPMDRLFYGTIVDHKTMCTGPQYSCEDVQTGTAPPAPVTLRCSVTNAYSPQAGSAGSNYRHCFDPITRNYMGKFDSVSCVMDISGSFYTHWPHNIHTYYQCTATIGQPIPILEQQCAFKPIEKMCNVLTTKHVFNTLQACGDLCASRTSCAAFTFMDQPSASCVTNIEAGLIVGQCILYSYTKVGQGVSKISLRGGPGEMRKITSWSESASPTEYKKVCLADPGAGVSQMHTLCNVGPGVDRSWPQRCGIVTYRKRSVVLDAPASGEGGSGSGEAGSGSGEAGSGSGEAGSGSGESGSGSDAQDAQGPDSYTAPKTFVGHGTC
jgi:hypothetical protein